MQHDQDRLGLTQDLLAFIGSAKTPYHAVAEVARRLSAHGFRPFDERAPWAVEPGARGFVVRAGSIIAFALGSEPPAEAGFTLIGAHTDSPNLRAKPLPDSASNGYRQLSIEVYGGVLLHTWLDRDLGIAGRVVLADGSESFTEIARPVARVPSLAIHLNRDVNRDGLVLNAQQHLLPVVSFESDGRDLLDHVALSLTTSGVTAKDVLGFDLCLFDVQPGNIGGFDGELVFSARLDNLASCHAGCTALIASGAARRKTRVLALYDHEEVGSQSAIGARSYFLESVLERLALGNPSAGPEAKPRALARSLLISADMAHGVHPNYPDKHDKQHRPQLGKGPVLKTNVNQSYATDGAGAAAFVAACREVGVVPQHFSARNDAPCGSTIGPISAARLGIRTVDVGNPMLSMHSCREMAAVADVEPMIRVLTHVYASE
jgi:aspartyl aminopeptidase